MPPRTRSQTTASSPLFRLESSAEPPVYRVDLSLPPRERYLEICQDYKSQLYDLQSLFQEVLALTPFPSLLKYLARITLRRLFSKEQNEEMLGMASATGIPPYLIIAFNTFLDLFSGCTSGGARVINSGPAGNTAGMVHFRGLDWEMESLRRLMICVEYLRDGKVVARALTYAGFIGVLTGVREGLSISLNYRARNNPSTSWLSYRLHQLLLVLGRRPSIASTLRDILLSPSPPPSLQALKEQLFKYPSSPCYLAFCTTSSVMVLEKDLKTSVMRESDNFLAVTNHDVEMESWTDEQWDELPKPVLDGARDLIEDSCERKQCVMGLWEHRNTQRLRVEDVAEWLQVKPVLNECTHYSCVMDPSVPGGGMLWAKIYDEPVDMDSGEFNVEVSDME